MPRLLGIGALGALAVLIGVFARADDDSAQAAADAVSSYGLGILVPLASLWFGASAIGDLVEDRLLAYLWLKPVPRWQLPAAAVLATVTVVLPLTAVPLTLVSARRGCRRRGLGRAPRRVAGRARLRRPVRRGGLWFRRAVWWGLAFILIWENFVGRSVEGTSRFTVIGWSSSVLGLRRRDRRAARGRIRGRRPVRSSGGRARGVVGRDLALPPGGHRLVRPASWP